MLSPKAFNLSHFSKFALNVIVLLVAAYPAALLAGEGCKFHLNENQRLKKAAEKNKFQGPKVFVRDSQVDIFRLRIYLQFDFENESF